jgi:integral membrane sensor domain MASE1
MLADKIYTNIRLGNHRRPLEYVVELTGIAIIYVGLAKLSLALASIHPTASPIWPPTGYALGTILLLGYRVSPAIFLGALVANVTTAGSISTSFAIATGNTLESLVGAYFINRWSDGRSTFDTPAGLARFVLICFIPSTIISATLGVGSLSLAGYADWSEFRSIWTTWWMGDLAGALVITPAIVLWGTTPLRRLERRELIQSCLIYAATIAVGLLAFSPLLKQSPTRNSLAFFVILPLMWAALRRNQRDTATVALLLSCFAVWGTMSNAGPFVSGSLNESFLLLLTFMISVSVPSLELSADVAVRRRHEEHVNFVMRELSHRSKNLLFIVQSMAKQVKHGALSVPTGVVTIRWGLETGEAQKPVLRITWEEVGGPNVEQPQREGFGDVVLTEIVPVSLRGTASLVFEPKGVKWVLLASSGGVLA